MTIPGVEITTLEPVADDRGAFNEIVRAGGAGVDLLQASHSRSKAGVLRGLHYHRVQTDLWYLARGRARIALADLRAGSEGLVTMTWVADADHPTTILIPPGVAHGYLALTDIEMLYLTDKEWDPGDEFGIAWDDPTIGIDWEIDPDRSKPLLSDRDRDNPRVDWQTIGTFS